MKFRRKSAEAAPAVEPEETADAADGTGEGAPAISGPYDVDDLPADDPTPRMDLGSLLIPAIDGMELRLQLDEETETIQAVLLANEEGAVEVRAFAAPRHGDLWSEVRPRLAADFAQRGGTASEREGRFGPEVVGQLTVKTAEGRTGTQVSRVIGVNGPRWMLRATLLGRPAVEPDQAGAWEDIIAGMAVRRGTQAMPSGAELVVSLPTEDGS